MNISARIKAKERDVEIALEQEKLQLLHEIKCHDYLSVTPAVIFKDEIILDKTETREIPRTIEILYEASKIPSADFYPILEDSSDEDTVKSIRRRK